MTDKKIDLIVGTRPNLVKAGALFPALAPHFTVRLLHTGQHYDINMKDSFIAALELPRPYDFQRRGSRCTDAVICDLRDFWTANGKPDLVMVVGDSDPVVSGSVAASMSQIPVAHVEAGLRAPEEERLLLPEEGNRVIADRLAQFHFCASEPDYRNLVREGLAVHPRDIVGNVMIDTLMACHERIDSVTAPWEPWGGDSERDCDAPVCVFTIHRQANMPRLKDYMRLLKHITRIGVNAPYPYTVYWPVHPRVPAGDLLDLEVAGMERVRVHGPIDYIMFQAWLQAADLVITDSGGLQEECLFYDTPCMVIRDGTERPVTLAYGKNMIVGTDVDRIIENFWAYVKILEAKVCSPPPFWDGKASERIAEILKKEAECGSW